MPSTTASNLRSSGGPRASRRKGACGCGPITKGGQVNVEVSDDGGGIDPQRIKRHAIEQRLVTVEQASRMGTQTLLGLIFLPGFSTAPAVTTMSGRGVGMDVVKTNIEKIGGSVDVHSTIGQGTTVPHPHSADAGHHQGARRHGCRRPLRDSPGQHRGTGPGRGRESSQRHPAHPRRAGLPLPGSSAAPGEPQPGAQGRRRRG